MSQNVHLSTLIDGTEQSILPRTSAAQVDFNGGNVDAELRALRALVTGKGSISVTPTIASRDQLTTTVGSLCWVVDASADASVAAGAACYLYQDDTAKWVKVAETESMDIVLAWASIAGKPSAAVADIDAAATLVKTLTASALELNRVKGVTAPLQEQLNAKASKNIATASDAGLMSGADKTKLDGVANGANNYVHPNSGATAGTFDAVTINAQGHVTKGEVLTAAQKLLATGITATAEQVNTAASEAIKLDAVVLGKTATLPSNLRAGALIIRTEA